MTMCILRARLAGWERPEVDLEACMAKCAPEEEPWAINEGMARTGREVEVDPIDAH
jgi:hypothetical protein